MDCTPQFKKAKKASRTLNVLGNVLIRFFWELQMQLLKMQNIL